VKLASIVVGIGNSSGRDVQKFEKFILTPLRAKCVAAPLIAECFANLECKVIDTRLVNKYGLFILEMLKAWGAPANGTVKTIHHQGYGRFVIDGKMLNLKSKMR
jgi:flavin reductase (DIM6/NTAB) family NADH-FMN oxidoreductase RutF